MFLVRLFNRTVLEGLSYSEFLESEKLQFYFITLQINLTGRYFFMPFIFIRSYKKTKLKSKKLLQEQQAQSLMH